ncbi:MAG: Rap1a/Tai family immunity protein [Ferrovibrio sp.]
MRLFVLAGLLAALLAPVAATAQSNPSLNPTGNLAPPPKFLGRDLLALCEGPEGGARLAGCQRYLQAAVAMYELIIAEGKELTLFCAPREAPPVLLRQQFVEWAKDNADQMAQDAIQTVRQALADAFPCQGD